MDPLYGIWEGPWRWRTHWQGTWERAKLPWWHVEARDHKGTKADNIAKATICLSIVEWIRGKPGTPSNLGGHTVISYMFERKSPVLSHQSVGLSVYLSVCLCISMRAFCVSLRTSLLRQASQPLRNNLRSSTCLRSAMSPISVWNDSSPAMSLEWSLERN